MSEAHIPAKHPQASQEARIPASHGDARRTGDHQEPPPQGSPHPLGLIWRVDRRDTFLALRRGRRGRNGPLTVSFVQGDPAEPPRVAFSIGRRVGSAVVRNRLRRRLRSFVRAVAHELPPGAYLVGVAPGAATLSPEDLRMTLMRALDALDTFARPRGQGGVPGGLAPTADR